MNHVRERLELFAACPKCRFYGTQKERELFISSNDLTQLSGNNSNNRDNGEKKKTLRRGMSEIQTSKFANKTCLLNLRVFVCVCGSVCANVLGIGV